MPAISKGNITYRVFENKDMESVIDLWKNHSGWGAITKDQFNKWNNENPYEPNLIILAADDEGMIVGQETFIPSRIYVYGKELKSLRVVAPILHENYRQPDLRNPLHPAIAMLKAGIDEATKRGYHFGYSFPAPGWLPIARLLSKFIPNPSESALFECAAISLKTRENYTESDRLYHITIANEFSSEYDLLWNEAKDSLPVKCAIVRNAKWLQWKLGGHLIIELRRKSDNALRGYCAIKKNSGLIEDVFSATYPELEITLKQSVSMLHHNNSERIELSLDTLKIMLTGPIQKSINGLRYQKDTYNFAFGSVLFNRDLEMTEFQSSQWYMMPND